MTGYVIVHVTGYVIVHVTGYVIVHVTGFVIVHVTGYVIVYVTGCLLCPYARARACAFYHMSKHMRVRLLKFLLVIVTIVTW